MCDELLVGTPAVCHYNSQINDIDDDNVPATTAAAVVKGLRQSLTVSMMAKRLAALLTVLALLATSHAYYVPRLKVSRKFSFLSPLFVAYVVGVNDFKIKTIAFSFGFVYGIFDPQPQMFKARNGVSLNKNGFESRQHSFFEDP